MPARHSLDHRLLDDHRARIPPQRREMREVSQQIGLGNRRRGPPYPARSREHRAPQLDEDALLDFDGAVVRGQYLALILLQLRRGEPLGIYQRLLALVVGGSHGHVSFGYLDVISKNRVIAYLQRTYAGPLALPILDGCD